MKNFIGILLTTAVAIIVAVLTATSVPVLFGAHLGGTMLLIHMMASGTLVFALPVFALFYLTRNISSETSGGLQRLGFWAMIVTGLLTIATVFACMLPYPSTDEMEQLIKWHGYAGFAMVPALLVLLIGAARWRRIQATRSATPG